MHALDADRHESYRASRLLGSSRAHASVPVFDMLMDIARACLDTRAMQKLELALGLEANTRLAA